MTYKAYQRILADDRLSSYSGTDAEQLKYVILSLLEYLIPNFTETGLWDTHCVTTIVRSFRPKSTEEDVRLITSYVRNALCEEMGIPPRGWRFYFRLDGQFLRFIPKKVTDVYDDLY